MQYQVSITTQGQITLPAEIRREWGVLPGDKIQFSKKNNIVQLTPKIDFLDLKGVVKATKQSKKFSRSTKTMDNRVAKHIADNYESR